MRRFLLLIALALIVALGANLALADRGGRIEPQTIYIADHMSTKPAMTGEMEYFVIRQIVSGTQIVEDVVYKTQNPDELPELMRKMVEQYILIPGCQFYP